MKNNINIKKILFVGLLLITLLFSNGKFPISFAVWISTTMLLYSVRKFSTLKGYLFAGLILSIASIVQFYEILPLPLVFHIIIMVVYAFVFALPYLIDLLFSKKRAHFLHTFIFPISFVLIEYFYYKFNPYGTWGHMAYTQESQSILVQSVSVFGMGFISFMITWFASIFNWVLLQEFKWAKIKKGVLTYGIVLGLTLTYGSYRLLFQTNHSKTVRVASLSATERLGIYDNNTYGMNVENEEAATKAKLHFQARTEELNQLLFDRSVKEAISGSKIVFWAEGNSYVLKENETELYKKASVIAKQHNIYLGMGLAVIDVTNEKPLENKFVVFNPQGKKEIDYWKVIPVPGPEATMSNVKGDKIQYIKTPYGTLGAAICFDMDFADYLKQAKNIDMFLAPSNDWLAIDPLHTHMARFRTIEQGFNLIRQTSNGRSVGADYTGNIISEMDDFVDNDKVLITQLPTQGITTIYSKIGDTFIGVCILLFILLIIKLKKEKMAVSVEPVKKSSIRL